MKRIFENSILLMLILVGLWLDSIAITKEMVYLAPTKYAIAAAEAVISAWWQRRLVFALVMAILTVVAVRMAAQRRTGMAVLSIIAIIVSIVTYGMIGTGYRTVIYVFQAVTIASYVLICYGTARVLRSHFPEEARTAVYLLIHVFFLVACSWHPLFHGFYIRPTTVVWMASAFMIAYWAAYSYQLIPLICLFYMNRDAKDRDAA